MIGVFWDRLNVTYACACCLIDNKSLSVGYRGEGEGHTPIGKLFL